MMAMVRVTLICAVLVLAGVPVHAQSSAAVSAARGAAASAGAPAREARATQQATPAPAPGGAAAAAPASGSAETTTPAAQGAAVKAVEPVGFAYKPEGRRDPFVSLADRGSDIRVGPRPAGLAGLGATEVTLRGTLRSRDGFVAMLQGADQKTYIVRPGDKLFDGMVSSISQNDLVILQQVNDPLSTEKQREVRKGLRQAEAN